MKTPAVKTEQHIISRISPMNNAGKKNREYSGISTVNQPITPEIIQDVKKINIKVLIEKETGLKFDKSYIQITTLPFLQ